MKYKLLLTLHVGRDLIFSCKTASILNYSRGVKACPVHHTVKGKESKSYTERDYVSPTTPPCSTIAHPGIVHSSPGSTLTGKGTHLSLPCLFCSDQSENDYSFSCPSIGNDRMPVYARCCPRSNACCPCKS